MKLKLHTEKIWCELIVNGKYPISSLSGLSFASCWRRLSSISLIDQSGSFQLNCRWECFVFPYINSIFFSCVHTAATTTVFAVVKMKKNHTNILRCLFSLLCRSPRPVENFPHLNSKTVSTRKLIYFLAINSNKCRSAANFPDVFLSLNFPPALSRSSLPVALN